MTEFSVCPEGGTWEEADRPNLSDVIHQAKDALSKWIRADGPMNDDGNRMRDALAELIPLAEQADRELKEYR